MSQTTPAPDVSKKDILPIIILLASMGFIIAGVCLNDTNWVGIGGPLAVLTLAAASGNGWDKWYTYALGALGVGLAVTGAVIAWNDPSFPMTGALIGLGTIVAILGEALVVRFAPS
ncbi:hypothetical protein [Clavibacter michiganensis]|uniref:hypothetical protein n=1 Tax=Clavibacter michiganensis TaxID=28447 RepID=UPI00292D7737|nr:hypothetical protein [Clavibacter michiganensis]